MPVAEASPGASGSVSFTDKPSGVYNYRLSDLQSSTSIEIKRPANTVITDRALFVHDKATINASGVSLRGLMNRLAQQMTAANLGDPVTGNDLFGRLWDTQNPLEQAVFPGIGEKCTGTLNDFSINCRPGEGNQARDPQAIDDFTPIALVNRFDLRDKQAFLHCGEYRVIFARRTLGRVFMIFEAQIPNPTPGIPEGCLPVAQFWQGLSTDKDPVSRGQKLNGFYFNGLPNASIRAAFDHRNYAQETGQIRTNEFMAGPWLLKEFKTSIRAGRNLIDAVTVKSNPQGALFSSSNPDPRAAPFRAEFLSHLASLLEGRDTFSLMNSDIFNNGQSHAQFPESGENDYAAVVNSDSDPAFKAALQQRLVALGSDLTTDQVLRRASAMTCGGCHEPSSFGLQDINSIGTGLSWPGTLGFVHVNEFSSPASPAFEISPALKNVFLPFRKKELEEFLASPLNVPDAALGTRTM